MDHVGLHFSSNTSHIATPRDVMQAVIAISYDGALLDDGEETTDSSERNLPRFFLWTFWNAIVVRPLQPTTTGDPPSPAIPPEGPPPSPNPPVPPSEAPSAAPSSIPSKLPSTQPSTLPSNLPSTQPSTLQPTDVCLLELGGLCEFAGGDDWQPFSW